MHEKMTEAFANISHASDNNFIPVSRSIITSSPFKIKITCGTSLQ